MNRKRKRSDRSGARVQRPPLSTEISLHDFRTYYWYLSELVAFCRQYDLDASGQKLDLVRRVEAYLRTGHRAVEPRRPGKRTRPSLPARNSPLTANTVVTAQFKCDAETRAFFKSVIGPQFHFTAHLQQFRREHQREGLRLTYSDLAREWVAEYERRKDKNYRPGIERSWQYLQFVRDFMADRPRNSGKSIRDVAKAWNEIREHRGSHTYTEYIRTRRK